MAQALRLVRSVKAVCGRPLIAAPRPALSRPALSRPALARPALARPGLARPALARVGRRCHSTRSSSPSLRREVVVRQVLPHARSDVFGVVADIGSYPQFLPFCTEAVLETSGAGPTSTGADVWRVTFAHSLFTEVLRYHVTADPPRELVSVARESTQAERLEFCWSFGDGGGDGDGDGNGGGDGDGARTTHVSLQLVVDFHSGASAMLFDMFSAKLQDKVMQAFAERVRDTSESPSIE